MLFASHIFSCIRCLYWYRVICNHFDWTIVSHGGFTTDLSGPYPGVLRWPCQVFRVLFDLWCCVKSVKTFLNIYRMYVFLDYFHLNLNSWIGLLLVLFSGVIMTKLVILWFLSSSKFHLIIVFSLIIFLETFITPIYYLL